MRRYRLQALCAMALIVTILTVSTEVQAVPAPYVVSYSVEAACSPACNGATVRISDLTSGATVLAEVGSSVTLTITETVDGNGIGRIRLETVDQQLIAAVPRAEVFGAGGRFENTSGLVYFNEVSVDITIAADVIDASFGLLFNDDEDSDGITNIDEDNKIRHARGFYLLLIQTGSSTIAQDLAPWLHTDFDGDGLPDADEFLLPDYDGDNVPTFADTDSDSDFGPDLDEWTSYHTNPYNPDTDDDGVRDGVEVRTFQTDPLDPDTDDDGVSDGEEIRAGSDPLDPNDPYDFSNPCRTREPNETYRYLIDRSSTNGLNWRLYQAFFLRQPDRAGFDYWNSTVIGGKATWPVVSNLFALSDEFRLTYGQLTNEAYVSLVYQNVLCREPEQAGQRYWIAGLDSDRVTRGEMMLEFSNSIEYRALTATL